VIFRDEGPSERYDPYLASIDPFSSNLPVSIPERVSQKLVEEVSVGGSTAPVEAQDRSASPALVHHVASGRVRRECRNSRVAPCPDPLSFDEEALHELALLACVRLWRYRETFPNVALANVSALLRSAPGGVPAKDRCDMCVNAPPDGRWLTLRVSERADRQPRENSRLRVFPPAADQWKVPLNQVGWSRRAPLTVLLWLDEASTRGTNRDFRCMQVRHASLGGGGR